MKSKCKIILTDEQKQFIQEEKEKLGKTKKEIISLMLDEYISNLKRPPINSIVDAINETQLERKINGKTYLSFSKVLEPILNNPYITLPNGEKSKIFISKIWEVKMDEPKMVLDNTTGIYVRDGIEKIKLNKFAFPYSDSKKLKYLRLPKSLKLIYNTSFYNCKNIKDIYYDGTVEQWQKVRGIKNKSFKNAIVHCQEDNKDILPNIPNTKKETKNEQNEDNNYDTSEQEKKENTFNINDYLEVFADTDDLPIFEQEEDNNKIIDVYDSSIEFVKE